MNSQCCSNRYYFSLTALYFFVTLTHLHAALQTHYQSGPLHGITDVTGVRIAHVTKISGSGALHPGIGPVRTGATAILPNDDIWNKRLSAATETLNGNGELTGTHWIKESGYLETPILITNTLNVGQVSDGVIDWMIKRYPQIGISDDVPIPVVGECDDQFLNDIQGRHVSSKDIVEALNHCSTGQFQRGNVGAGVGMILFGFKGGIGSASCILPQSQGGYVVGVLVNANNGSQPLSDLLIDGVGVGRILEAEKQLPRRINHVKEAIDKKIPDGSIVVVLATDAPLEARELHQLAKRAILGLGRTGLTSNISSGDFIIAFSTTHWISRNREHQSQTPIEINNDRLNALFEATVQSVEAAVDDALFSAKTMIGINDRKIDALPLERVAQILKDSPSRIKNYE